MSLIKINFLYEPTSRSELFVCVTVYTTETGTGLNASTVSAPIAHQILSVCAVHHEDKALVRGGQRATSNPLFLMNSASMHCVG